MNPDQHWNPATRNLVAELPELMGTLSTGSFELFRVMFNPNDWDDSPRAFVVRGRKVKLGSFTTQHHGMITVVDGSGRNRIDVYNDAAKPVAAVPA